MNCFGFALHKDVPISVARNIIGNVYRAFPESERETIMAVVPKIHNPSPSISCVVAVGEGALRWKFINKFYDECVVAEIEVGRPVIVTLIESMEIL